MLVTMKTVAIVMTIFTALTSLDRCFFGVLEFPIDPLDLVPVAMLDGVYLFASLHNLLLFKRTDSRMVHNTTDKNVTNGRIIETNKMVTLCNRNTIGLVVGIALKTVLFLLKSNVQPIPNLTKLFGYKENVVPK